MKQSSLSQTILYHCPLGVLTLQFTDDGLSAITFGASKKHKNNPVNLGVSTATIKGLDEYFLKKRKSFVFPKNMRGTPFELKVWRALTSIPYGKTMSYKELAQRIGHPRAYRAVGSACRRNPVPIVIPCHRVIRSDGRIGEYVGGTKRKKWLLTYEATS